MQFLQVWGKNGRPVGESGFALTVLGTVPDAKDRTVRFDYHFSNFAATGNTKTSGLIVNTKVEQKILVSHAQKRESGLMPPKKSFDALRAAPNYRHNVIFDAGQGVKPDDLIAMAYVPYVSVKYPTGYVGTNPGPERVTFAAMNWDAASYLPNSRASDPKKRGGVAFANKVTLHYSSKQGAPEKAVADHLKLAHTNPSKTKPPNSHKNVPGFEVNRPLHRLYPDRDKSRYRANRRTAVSMCVTYWGKDYATSDPAGPRECDEYPFASTYEGAGQHSKEPSAPKDNFSALPIPKDQNKAGGTILALFYDKNRILNGRDSKGQEVDAYLMAIG
ncbi:NucA/NucB deoxyribonuclease domain-containing protein [Streptomyces sp. NPDC001739]